MLDIAIRGAFINLGQNCVSAERFFVHDKIYDKFVTDISARVKQLTQGSAQEEGRFDFGSITMANQVCVVLLLLLLFLYLSICLLICLLLLVDL
jgi:succinate-semialdehyde dehydrogenase/glutarate-semialdehyde dehydrogenase